MYRQKVFDYLSDAREFLNENKVQPSDVVFLQYASLIPGSNSKYGWILLYFDRRVIDASNNSQNQDD